MTKSVFHKILFSFFFFSLSISIAAKGIEISGTSSNGSFALVANYATVAIVVDKADAEVVGVAALALSQDVKLLTGLTPAIKNVTDNLPSVIIGTLGKSALIDKLVTDGKIDKLKLEGKWETFLISVIDLATGPSLVIAGSDPRGTAFGVFELSRMMGISPWIWWADVLPEARESIYISGNELLGPPSVKYRGMFINDEDFAINPWASKKMDTDIKDIGPRTHEKIFELMLRTKSNFFWPAMHGCTKAFWYYTANPVVARKYAIVLGSSHCEPMLRNNEDEWNRNFTKEFPGVTKGEWNWKTNSTVIKNYWINRIKESKNTEAVYTMGMRGVHDSQMLGYNTDKERAEALKDIIANQRNILETYIGKPKTSVPQLFCPYKEALLHYNQGIALPEDVTLLWPDDNHGFIRQLSTPEEQARSGGGGVYYHFSYWGPPRQDYLWLSSTSPVKISLEMSKAYDFNAKNIWVFNVGDIKPAEFEYQFAMDLAWNVDAWRPEKANEYARSWAQETFGSGLADAVAEIQSQHYYLSASGRPDQMDWSSYSVAEMEQRLTDYTALVEKVKALESQIPERLKAAYFQLITYPVQAAAAMNEKILGAKLSYIYASQGKKAEALVISERAKEAYRIIRDLTYTYNKVLVDGKWDGMMNYAPKSMGFFFEPNVADSEVLANDSFVSEEIETVISIPAGDFQSKTGDVKIIKELGVAGSSVTVLPYNMTVYTAANITSAPNVTYKVRLKKGNNRITIKCMPTFPIYPGLDLRYAVSVDAATPQFTSIKTIEGQSEWRLGVLRGFTGSDVMVQSTSEKDALVKVYFADPGLVLSAIDVSSPQVSPYTALIVNPDFEYDKNGKQLSGLTRGDPYGWSHIGTMKGNSWGTNQDAINYHGQNACWYVSTPFPSNLELTQTIKGLPAGEYLLRCRLGVPDKKMTNQRLFANNYVQYFGKDSDYVSNLTTGEKNTFAGYKPFSESSDAIMLGLKEMALKFVVLDGEDLRIGIRSGNRLSNGTSATDNSGWFKVDDFRLELIRELNAQTLKSQLEALIQEAQDLYTTTKEGNASGEYPQQARAAFQGIIQAAQSANQNTNSTMSQLLVAVENLQKSIKDYKQSVVGLTSFIVNASFEYKSEGVLNDGTTFRGTPYGWTDTGGIFGTSFGINSDANNKDGGNVCWYSSAPMPAAFELYQNIGSLPAGEYTVRCKMSVPNDMITTQRLFANDDVQYFGYESNYGANLVSGENYSFASWPTSNDHNLQELKVDVTIEEGETLKLGVRSNNIKKDGSAATNTAGWFKLDHFRLELKNLYGDISGLKFVEEGFFKIIGEKNACRIIFEQPFSDTFVRIVSLSGNTVYADKISNQQTRISLPQGLYVLLATQNGQSKSAKFLVM